MFPQKFENKAGWVSITDPEGSCGCESVEFVPELHSHGERLGDLVLWFLVAWGWWKTGGNRHIPTKTALRAPPSVPSGPRLAPLLLALHRAQLADGPSTALQ